MHTVTMMKEIDLPDYKTFYEYLLSLDTELTPAECQGIALGLLAWGRKLRAEEAWANLLAEAIGSEKQQWFDALFLQAKAGLEDESCALLLYLPTDVSPLYQRVEALSQWCKGFMFGLGLIGFDNRMLSHPLVNEALQDISQIMNIEINITDPTENNEKEYFELMEYLRMATLVIYSEITEVQGMGTGAHGLH